MRWGALEIMTAQPELYQPALVRTWAKDWDSLPAAVRAVQAAGREGDIYPIREYVYKSLMRYPYESTMDALLAIPGSESSWMLLEFASTTEDGSLRALALDRLKARRELAEIERSLNSPLGGQATRESAIREVLGLLEDPNILVRIEAIRGLATLGAVEHLPRLIRMVGSENADESAAAKEALASLNRQAVEKLRQSSSDE